jgi:hypothetical protein
MRAGVSIAVVVLAGAALTAAAAELGGGRHGLEADRAHLTATMATTTAATHQLHTLTLADGDVVREFTTADGTVFAVAWTGPARPDLRQLLGPAFDTLQADVTASRRRPRQGLAMVHDDLVIRSAGHPGAFHGYAYLPHLAPPGFAADALE